MPTKGKPAAKISAAKQKPNPSKPLQRRSLAIKLGRESVYDPDKHPERVRRMGLLNLTDSEMCFQLGISESVFYTWSKLYPDFKEAIAAGKSLADEEVAETLWKRATGRVKIPAMKIFYDKDQDEGKRVIYAPHVETPPPDTNAIRMWLHNRRPKDWRERREVEVTGGLEFRIAQMSPDERLARLKELQVKAGAIIEGVATEITEE